MRSNNSQRVFSKALMLFCILFLSFGKPVYSFYSSFSNLAMPAKKQASVTPTHKSFFVSAGDELYTEPEAEEEDNDPQHNDHTDLILSHNNSNSHRHGVARVTSEAHRFRVPLYILFHNWKSFLLS